MTHHLDLNTIILEKGGHDIREKGVCLLEAVAWWADKEHTDSPACVSPVLRNFGISLNDRLPDDKRQQLVPLIPKLIGTAGDGFDVRRGYLALDWLIRVYTSAWLDLAGLTTEAGTLRDLHPIVDLAAAQTARPAVLGARNAARPAAGDAAWAAIRDAAGEAAGDAAWAAARAAARAAAGDAAWAAAGAAAWDAARAAAWAAAWAAAGDAAWAAARAAAWVAAWDAARAAARAAIREAAGAAAWDAARAAAGDAAWAAIREAAGDALQPAIDRLQDSAIVLFTRMVTPDA